VRSSVSCCCAVAQQTCVAHADDRLEDVGVVRAYEEYERTSA
jgi:hypothetical protein